MSISIPFGIPPAAPREPVKHSDPDIDIIIKLLEEIRNFMDTYINDYLPYLIDEGLEFLVPDFQQQMIPIMNQKTHQVISILSQPGTEDSTAIRQGLSQVELGGRSLEFKDRSIRANINRLFRWARQGITKGLKVVAEPVFKVINSFLGSLIEAIGFIAGVGKALDVIKQIKEHLEATSTLVRDESLKSVESK
jgi:hypothetical protein